jgi:putative ABC transport system permease protein
MFGIHLKLAFRHLAKHKGFAFINLAGLSIAVAACLLLLLSAFRQLGFDRFHTNHARIYRLYTEANLPDSRTEKVTAMPHPLAPALQAELTGVEAVARYRSSGGEVEVDGRRSREGLRFVDPAFFAVFSFPFVEGDPATALNERDGLVLTQKAAKRLFGENASALGRTLRAFVEGKELTLRVTGVLKDLPETSSLRFNLVTRFENNPSHEISRDRWDNVDHDVYVLAQPGYPVAQLDAQLQTFAEKHFQTNIENLRRDGAVAGPDGKVYRLKAQPLDRVHFDTSINSGAVRDAVHPGFIWGLIAIGLMILGIASINFINLTLGRGATRTGEVAVRKVLGAGNRTVLAQFWSESLIVIAIAVALGVLWARLALPAYNTFFRSTLTLADASVLTPLAVILLFAGLLGGGYPALVIARFQPVKMLKQQAGVARVGRFRSALIVMQFFISVLLVASTLIIGRQVHYLREKPLGFNESEVISIPVGNPAEAATLLERLRQKLDGHTAIHSVSAASNNLGMGKDGSSYRSIIGFDQDGRQAQTHWLGVDYDYITALDIPLVQGRNFSRDYASDTASAVLINETFAKSLGYADPVGQYLNMEPKRQIVGVFSDFHFQSLHHRIEPLTLYLDRSQLYNYILVRVANGQLASTMALLEKTWKEVAPQTAWNASFLDENTERQYEEEKHLATLFQVAAGLAIVLSCMGLFAIAVLTIAQRTKEIGIRKVLGASAGHITGLFTVYFLRLVVIAMVLAAPAAFYLMRLWLKEFAYSVEPSVWVLLGAGALVAAIALVTVSIQTIRAALMNPVKSLRSE